MSLVSPHQLLRDVFIESPRGPKRRWRKSALAYIVPALLAGAAGWRFGIESTSPEAILAALAILTGVTFAMAVTFWDRSVQARSDPNMATNAIRLRVIDHMKGHLIYTVVIGVLATGILMVVTLFLEASLPLPSWLAAIVAGTSIYEVTLVGAALVEFYRASYDLR